MASEGLVNGSISNLIGGVSQQPWNVRLPSQGQTMKNCHATISEFLHRRPAFSQIGQISVPSNDSNLVAYAIDKGTDEKYICLFNNDGVAVYDLEGNAKTVTVTKSGKAYLKSVTDPKTQLRFCTIKDYTFVTNTKKKVEQSTQTVTARTPEGLVFVNQASYLTDYSIILNGDTYTYTTPSSTYEEGTDPPDLSANLILKNLKALIDAGKKKVMSEGITLVGSVYLNDVEFKGLGRKYELNLYYKTTSNSDEGNDESSPIGITISTNASSRDIYFDEDRGRAIVYTSSNKSWVLVSGVTKYDLVAGSKIECTIENIFPSSKVSGTIPSGSDGAYVIVAGDNVSSYITSSGEVVVIESNYNVKVSGATMYITSKDGSEFTLSVEDSRSNTHMDSWKYECSSIEDLPTTAPKNYLLRISGDNGTDIDDYYVKFIPTSGTTMTKGIWKECAYPSEHMGFDKSTMPHVLTRNSDGTFTFDQAPWEDREVGDEDTNGMPSFVNNYITNILFYRNRLCFLSGDNIIMSETNEFFNFFLTTMLTAVDNDPIDVAASGVKDTSLYGASVFSGGLILFSTKAQFLVEHDTVLSNSTVSLSPVTGFESTDSVTPVSSGKTIFFGVKHGKYVGIREYIAFDSDNSASNDATDITAAVPAYIEGNPIDLQCSSNEDIVIVRTDDDLSHIYVYKYFWNGNQKAQSSWYEWNLSGDCYSTLFFNDEVYCVMNHGDEWYLEKFSFEPSHKDSGEDFEFCIDRKVTEEFCTIGEYDPINKRTTVTIPYDDSRAILVTRSGGDWKAGNILPEVSRDGTTITIKGKVTTATKFFVGIPYESLYTFTTIGIRNTSNNSAVTTGRLQLRNMSLNLNKTGYCDMVVAPKGKLPSTFHFTGKRIGEDSSTIGEIPIYTGQIRFPVLSVNNTTEITAKSSSFLPFAIVNADWEGYYTNRSSASAR